MTNNFSVFDDTTEPVHPEGEPTSKPTVTRRRRTPGGRVTRPEDIVRAPVETETLTTVSIRIPEQLAERLRAHSFVHRVTQQEVVRRALEDYLS